MCHYGVYAGGNTKFYGVALFRLRPADVGEVRHYDGVPPAWPIGYSGAMAHQAGTVRFGTDPASSALASPAGRTSSATSTWSARASSRASAP